MYLPDWERGWYGTDMWTVKDMDIVHSHHTSLLHLELATDDLLDEVYLDLVVIKSCHIQSIFSKDILEAPEEVIHLKYNKASTIS